MNVTANDAMEAEISLFLGAGASHGFGIPVISGLVAELPKPARTIYDAVSQGSPGYAIEDFLQSLADVERLQCDKAGSEILRACGYVQDRSTDLKSIRLSVLQHIHRSCRLADSSVSSACAAYKRLIGPALIAKVYPRVFTTNYDDVLEKVSIHEGYKCLTGFSNRAGHSNPIYTDEFAFEELCYFKLHGSIDWWKEADSGSIYRQLRIDVDTKDSALMMYPVRGKPYFDEPFVTLYMHFLRILRQTRRLFVIGSRLADENVTQPLRHAVETGRLQVWIVDPKASDIKKACGWAECEKVTPIDMTFLDWVQEGASEWHAAIPDLQKLHGPNDVFLRSARDKAWPHWP